MTSSPSESSQSDVIINEMSSVALDMGEKYQDGQYNEQQQSLIREQPPSYKVSHEPICPMLSGNTGNKTGYGHVAGHFSVT